MIEMPDEQVSLKVLAEQRFDAMDKALHVATQQMDKRLDGMNEFRESLRDQAAQMVTRTECSILHKKIDEDLRILRESKAMLEGKASQLSVNITLAIAIVGSIVSVVALLTR